HGGEPPRRHLQRPCAAIDAHGRPRRIRRRRSLQGLESAIGAASHDRRAGAVALRCRRSLVAARARRLHVSCQPSGRPQLRHLSGECERSGVATSCPLLAARPCARPRDRARRAAESRDADNARPPMESVIRTRFAPSPTGFLHLGNIRSALFPWAFARHHGGTFILRIEDTDQERSTPEATQAIVDAMQWLGLDYEGPYYQMQRMARYREVLDDMLARGLAYRCYTTPAELDVMRTQQTARGEKP